MIVVSLTSYPARIKHCDYIISHFIDSQTVKPDLFYFWLSVLDFPNKEKDLPSTLLTVINVYGIQLRWCEDNTFVCKRFNVYPKHLNDYCIFIDDDIVYSTTLIEDALKVLKKHPDSICNIWRQFTGKPIFNGIKRVDWKYLPVEKSTMHWAQGNCVIPPGIFPYEDAFNPELINLRNTFYPQCDEVWLNSVFFKNKIPISYIPTFSKFMNIKVFVNSDDHIHLTNEKIYGKNLEYKDVNLFITLSFLNLLEEYDKVFKYNLK